MNQQARRFSLTLNNWSQDEYDKIKCYAATKLFYIIGKEIGSENNTPHLQIYLESKTGIRISTLKKLNNRMHIEICKGSRKQNYDYCSKEGDFITNITPDDLVKKDKNIELELFRKHYLEHNYEDKIDIIKNFINNIDKFIEIDYDDINRKIKKLIDFCKKIKNCKHCIDKYNIDECYNKLIMIEDKY